MSFALTRFSNPGAANAVRNAAATPPAAVQNPTPVAPRPADPESQSSRPGSRPTSPAANPEAATSSCRACHRDAPSSVPELVSKLDTKTAKAGDNVVVQTKAAVKTADGTEIPKGSKLTGHVVAVQPSTAGHNSQVALQFDRAELSGGKSLPIQSEIQSIAPAGGSSDSTDHETGAAMGSAAPPNPSSPNGAMGGSAAGNTGAGSAPGYTPGYTPNAGAGASASGEPAAGSIVARNGKIAIRSTSVPGVLLANNAPGEHSHADDAGFRRPAGGRRKMCS